jgi:hypothetical protein
VTPGVLVAGVVVTHADGRAEAVGEMTPVSRRGSASHAMPSSGPRSSSSVADRQPLRIAPVRVEHGLRVLLEGAIAAVPVGLGLSGGGQGHDRGDREERADDTGTTCIVRLLSGHEGLALRSRGEADGGHLRSWAVRVVRSASPGGPGGGDGSHAAPGR